MSLEMRKLTLNKNCGKIQEPILGRRDVSYCLYSQGDRVDETIFN